MRRSFSEDGSVVDLNPQSKIQNPQSNSPVPLFECKESYLYIYGHLRYLLPAGRAIVTLKV